MADQIKKEEVKSPDKIFETGEGEARFERQREATTEKREISSDDNRVSAELRREIEMMQLDEKLKGEAEKKVQKIEFLGEKEKIEHLLQLAREKGIVFAIKVARGTNDPYLLDILHDTLAQEGFYRKMGKTTDDDTNNDDKKT